MSRLSLLVLTAAALALPLAPAAAEVPALCSTSAGSTSPGSTSPGLFAAATADRTGGAPEAMCTADCGDLPNVSCSGVTCNAVNRSCPGERGHVTCDGDTIYCPTCDIECVNGQMKFEIAGPFCSCDAGGAFGTPRDKFLCVDGQWVFQESFCGGPFCQ